jgi:hypothetical protein
MGGPLVAGEVRCAVVYIQPLQHKIPPKQARAASFPPNTHTLDQQPLLLREGSTQKLLWPAPRPVAPTDRGGGESKLVSSIFKLVCFGVHALAPLRKHRKMSKNHLSVPIVL